MSLQMLYVSVWGKHSSENTWWCQRLMTRGANLYLTMTTVQSLLRFISPHLLSLHFLHLLKSYLLIRNSLFQHLSSSLFCEINMQGLWHWFIPAVLKLSLMCSNWEAIKSSCPRSCLFIYLLIFNHSKQKELKLNFTLKKDLYNNIIYFYHPFFFFLPPVTLHSISRAHPTCWKYLALLFLGLFCIHLDHFSSAWNRTWPAQRDSDSYQVTCQANLNVCSSEMFDGVCVVPLHWSIISILTKKTKKKHWDACGKDKDAFNTSNQSC